MQQILLVEGNDDLHVMYAICEKYELPENFAIKEFGGINKQLKSLKNLYLTGIAKSDIGTPFKTIGVVVDADSTAGNRWEQIKTILSKHTSQTLEIPHTGLIITLENQTKFGLWIMPNNITTGMLEDFMAFLIPESDDLIEKTNDFLQDIEDSSLHRYKLIHKQKAKIHSWLALQEDPGTPMGLAITKKYLDMDINNQVRDDFVNWIKALFQ